MSQGQGNQPINLYVICDERDEERIALLHHFLKDDGEIDEDEAVILALHDRNTSRLEQAAACIQTGVAWFKSLTTGGNRRTRDLTAQYTARYGEPIAAD